MGGASPGVYPPSLRIGALVQAALLVATALIVLARSELALRRWARVSAWLIWLVVALCALSLTLNLMTSSTGERALWAPVVAVLLVCSLVVAIWTRRASTS
jgi:hypothetical protein